MKELKRILSDRRFLLVLMAILLLNGILFYKEIKPEEESVEYQIEFYGENYKEDLEKLRNKQEAKYGKMNMETAYKEISSLCNEYEEKGRQFQETLLQEWDGTGEFPDYNDAFTQEERRYHAVLLGLKAEYGYILGYRGDIQQILDRADEQVKDSNIFKEDSFAGRNIKKTKADFEKILEIQPKSGSQDAFLAVCNYNLSDFIMLLAIAAVVVVILDERKKGLWEFVYSMPKGRRRLSLYRIGATGAASLLTSALVYGENLLFAGIYLGGYGDVTRPIQSMEICERVILKTSVAGYMFLVFFWKFFLLFLVGLFLLLLVLIMKNYMQVFFGFAILMAGEYIAYLSIDVHSQFAIFKYVNIFAWMDAEWCMRNYLNLNFFGYPVGLYQMMCIMPVVLFFMIGLAVFRSGNTYPFVIKESWFRKVCTGLTAWLRPYRHGSMLLTELYKQFVLQKIWVIVLLAVLISWYRFDNRKVYYDYKGTLYNAYMEMLEGEATEEKREYLQKENWLWQEKRQEQEELFDNENLTSMEKLSIEGKIKQFQTAEICTEELKAEAERLLEKKEAKIAAQFVNKTGYNHYIGADSKERNMMDGLLMLALAVLAASSLFAGENAQNSVMFIRSTKKGRMKFRICKYAVLMIEELCIFIPVVLSAYLTVSAKYGVKQMWVSAYSLPFLDDFFMDISIAAALALHLILMFVILYITMLVITLISEHMKNVMASMVVCMAVAVLPAAFYYMGFSYISGFTILDELVVSRWLF
ncbi:MAG: hypothetical protein K1W19_06250 [Lachnospiraceae bacterium]